MAKDELCKSEKKKEDDSVVSFWKAKVLPLKRKAGVSVAEVEESVQTNFIYVEAIPPGIHIIYIKENHDTCGFIHPLQAGVKKQDTDLIEVRCKMHADRVK